MFKVLIIGLFLSCAAISTNSQAQTGNYPTRSGLNGFYISGNPDAKVKVKVLLSLSCPHCKSFYLDTFTEARKKYVPTGLVSFEIIEASSEPIAGFYGYIYAHCIGSNKYFDTLEALFEHQHVMISDGAYAWIMTTAKATGVSEQKAKYCVTHKGAIDAGTNRFNAAATILNDRDIDGLPSVIVNGQVVGYWKMEEAIEYYLAR